MSVWVDERGRPELRIGDIVVLDSPDFDVYGCRAEVIGLDTIRVKPLDGTTFDHGEFTITGCHFLEYDDTYVIEPKIRINLPEELFEL